mgnify:CR=1 FL=1
MNLKKLKPSLVLFFLLVVLAGAALEDSSLTLPETLDATLDQENGTTAQIVEQEGNLVIEDIIEAASKKKKERLYKSLEKLDKKSEIYKKLNKILNK